MEGIEMEFMIYNPVDFINNIHGSLDTPLWLTTTYEGHIPMIIQTVILRDTQYIVSVTYPTTATADITSVTHLFTSVNKADLKKERNINIVIERSMTFRKIISKLLRIK